jgi:c-di-GMP-binding flagellar brake protein YcgR
MNIILISILAAVVLFIIYVLSSREDRDIKDRFAPHGKVEGFYSGGSERRKSERFDAELDVKYSVLKSSPASLRTNIKNISESGVAVLLYEILPKNSVVDMDIALPEKKENVKIKGRVAWCDDRNGPERFDKDGRRTFIAGIEFVETDEKQKNRIVSYINSRLAS